MWRPIVHDWKRASKRYRAALHAACLKNEGYKRTLIWIISHLSAEQLWLLDQLSNAELAKPDQMVNAKGGRA